MLCLFRQPVVAVSNVIPTPRSGMVLLLRNNNSGKRKNNKSWDGSFEYSDA